MMRMSKSFAARWDAARLRPSMLDIALHPRLGEAIGAPFACLNGGVFFQPLLTHATRRDSFPDVTGYEAFVNKIHVEDLLEEVEGSPDEQLEVLLIQGVIAALRLSNRLRDIGEFRVLLSLDPDIPTLSLRFFGRRNGESWGPEAPEAVELEELLIVDSSSSDTSSG